MASEYLNSFISLYKEKAQLSLDKAAKNLEKRQGQLESFNALRPPLLEELKTLGFLEDFERLFPENGEGPIFSQADIMTYSSMLESVDDSKQLKAFNKIDRAPSRLKVAEEYLEYAEADLYVRDPEEYLGELYMALMSRLSKASSLGAGAIKAFEDQDTYDELIEYAAVEVDGPSGLKTNPITFAVLKEMVDGKVSEDAESSESDDSEETSPINKETEDKTQEEESSELAEPIEQDEDYSEIEVETSNALEIPEKDPLASLSINKEVEEEPAEPEEETTATSTVNTVSESKDEIEKPNVTEDTISIESNQDILDEESSSENDIQDNQSASVVNNITNTSESVNDNTSTENNNSINNQVAGSKGVANSGGKKSQGDSFITSFLSSMTGLSTDELNTLTNSSQESTINNVNNTGDISNQANTQLGDALGDVSTDLNVTNISQINDIPGVPSGLSKGLDKVKNVTNDLQTSSNFSSFEKSSLIKPDPITKKDIDSVGKNISDDFSSTMEATTTSQENNMPESSYSGDISSSSSSESPVSQSGSKNEKQGSVSVNNDTAALEKRLKNIEILLMGPLEVKIKN